MKTDYRIELQQKTDGIWQNLYADMRRFPLLQDPRYGKAMQVLEGFQPRFGVIYKGETAIGIFMLQEKIALKGLLHVVLLDRGPVFVESHGSEDDWRGFLRAFNKQLPRRWGRMRRLFLETDHEQLLLDAGMRPRKNMPSYQTIWLDIAQGIEALKSGLHKNWRNSLSKAQKQKLELVWDDLGRGLPEFLMAYEADVTQRQYRAASTQTLLTMAASFGPSRKLLLGKAVDVKGTVHAQCLFFLHGASATYQAGIVNPAGRASAANHLLLFEAISYLAKQGIKDCDLGGINDSEQAAGLTSFKKAMGGDVVRLAGAYC